MKSSRKRISTLLALTGFIFSIPNISLMSFFSIIRNLQLMLISVMYFNFFSIDNIFNLKILILWYTSLRWRIKNMEYHNSHHGCRKRQKKKNNVIDSLQREGRLETNSLPIRLAKTKTFFLRNSLCPAAEDCYLSW